MTRTLDNIMTMAQRSANNENRLMTVWNLNQFSPLYVIRDAGDGDEAKHGYVATVHPQEPTYDDLDALR